MSKPKSFIAYMITNTVSGKRYIGITTADLTRRWQEHRRPGSKCVALVQAIKKYGEQAFEIEHVASARTWADLCEVEVALIAQYGTFGHGYNMTSGGIGGAGAIRTPEHKAKIGAALTGRVRSASELAKQRAAHLGKKAPPETRAKMVMAHKARVRLPDIGARISAGKRAASLLRRQARLEVEPMLPL